MAIETNSNITWGELISRAESNLQNNIENLTGASIPTELNGSTWTLFDTEVATTKAHIKQHVITKARSNRSWGVVNWNDVKADFHNFLHSKGLDTNERKDQLVSTRLILNFFENLSLFYTNRLVVVYSPLGNQPRKLYYFNDGSSYNSWVGTVDNIESPVQGKSIETTEVKTLMDSINSNLKNKIKTYQQSYTFETACSSCSSSCSSSSSSSSSCWTIIHQDLRML